jgi:predicted amidohydrolase YtcJ
MPMTPEITLKNGIFWTGNKHNPYADQIACADGRISQVGSDASNTEPADIVLDLDGRFAMPGFIDAHTHFRAGGAMLARIDLREVRSEKEFSELVRTSARNHPAGKWMLGGNWDHENWESRRLPSKELIDKDTSSFPLFLDRVDTHMALVNSRALDAAGISRQTPDPPGGIIVRDANGEPTGILKDAAREMVLRHIPEPTLEDLLRDVRGAMRLANTFGVTSVNEIGPERDLRAYLELDRQGELSVRINMVLPISDYRLLTNRQTTASAAAGNSDWVKLGAVKGFADGSLGAGTAWFFEHYTDEVSNYGLATGPLSSGKLEQSALNADRNRIQLAIHAIGDKAVAAVLDIYGKIQDANPPWDRRFRIEHAQHLREEDFRRFSDMRIIASVQPYHCIDDGRWAARKIGSDRARFAFPFKRFLDEGINLLTAVGGKVIYSDGTIYNAELHGNSAA